MILTEQGRVKFKYNNEEVSYRKPAEEKSVDQNQKVARMKEIVPQKPLEPVLHGFLLKDRKFVLPSKIKILNFLQCFPYRKHESEK